MFHLFSKQLSNISRANDEIIEGEDIIFHMTTTENQDHYLKNNLYNNISSLNFSEC